MFHSPCPYSDNHRPCVLTPELYAVTTIKQKVEHSEANCQRNLIFYDISTKYSYEVETATLPYEEAVWLQQLVALHNVTKDKRNILITDSEAEISDSDSETNRHKFTYKFARNEQTLSPPTIPQVFSEEYQSQFQQFSPLTTNLL